MKSSIEGGASCSFFSFFLVFAFYALNLDSVLAYIKWSSYFYQIAVGAVLLLCCGYVGALKQMSLFRSLVASMIAKWILFLVVISLSYFFVADPDYSGIGLSFLLSTILIVFSLKIACICIDVKADCGRPLAIVLLVSALLVIIDPIIDIRSYFDNQHFFEYERTRGGGLYFQPNVASVVLVFLLAAALPRTSGSIKVLLCGVSSLAIFLTFSRSGLILLCLLLMISVWRKYISVHMFALFCTIPIVLIGATSIGDNVASFFSIDEGSGYIRMYEMQDMLSEAGIKSDSRTETAEIAISDFFEAPLGKGLGYSWKWADKQPEGQGTHNLNLRYMLEFGVLGMCVWPLFLFSLFFDRIKGLDRPWLLGICGIAFLSSFFSHNLTEQGAILASMYAVFSLPVKKKESGKFN